MMVITVNAIWQAWLLWTVILASITAIVILPIFWSDIKTWHQKRWIKRLGKNWNTQSGRIKIKATRVR